MNRDHYLGGAIIASICMLLAGFMWAIQPKSKSSLCSTANDSNIRVTKTVASITNAAKPRYIVDPDAVRNYTSGKASQDIGQVQSKPQPRIHIISTVPRENQPGPTQTMPVEGQRAPQ